MIWILYGKCTKISIYCTKKYIIYELLLEGREGAGAVRLGGWCQGRGRCWGDGCRGGEGAGAVALGDWCVLDKKVCWSNDLGEEQCTTAREPGGSFAVRAIALSK